MSSKTEQSALAACYCVKGFFFHSTDKKYVSYTLYPSHTCLLFKSDDDLCSQIRIVVIHKSLKLPYIKCGLWSITLDQA